MFVSSIGCVHTWKIVGLHACRPLSTNAPTAKYYNGLIIMDRTRALDACVSAVKCIRSGHGFCSYNCNHSQMVDMPALADWYYSLQDDVRKEMQSDETITRAILGYENFFKSFEMSRGFSSTTVFR